MHAIKLLGIAVHPIMDWSSPMHTDPRGNPIEWRGITSGWGHSPGAPYDPWNGLGNENLADIPPGLFERTDRQLNDAFDYVFGSPK